LEAWEIHEIETFEIIRSEPVVINGKILKFIEDIFGTEIKEITDGRSLESNIELVYNNANVASKLALELSNVK